MAETSKPQSLSDMICPMRGKEMRKVCHTCPLWTKIVGKDPQSEKLIEQWDCAWAILPLLLIENSQMQRQTGAAVETFRNETVKSNAQTVAAFAMALRENTVVMGQALSSIAAAAGNLKGIEHAPNDHSR